MLMKNKFTGVMNVFKFSYMQILKSKVFIISTLIFMAVALLALPISTAISRAGKDEVKIDNSEYIGNVYVCDEALDGKLGESLVDIIKQDPVYSQKNISIVSKEEYDKTFDDVKASEIGDLLVDIKFDDSPISMDYGFSYVVFYGEKIDELKDEIISYRNIIEAVRNDHKKEIEMLEGKYSNIVKNEKERLLDEFNSKLELERRTKELVIKTLEQERDTLQMKLKEI
jgi:hypothetical protein